MLRFNKRLDKNLSSVDYEEIIEFYNILLKYKSHHPNFNISKVILKVYPRLNLNCLCFNRIIKYYKVRC